MNNSIHITRTALYKKQFDHSYENIKITDMPLQGIVEVLYAVYVAGQSELNFELSAENSN